MHGQNVVVNLSWSVSPFLSLGRRLGSFDVKGTKWWELAVPCRRCQKAVTYNSGIICANFGATRGARFSACDTAYCAVCFGPSDLDPRDVAVPADFIGAEIEEDDPDRFLRARPGDHICTSYQCSNCHSQNIRGRDLDPSRMADECFNALCTAAQLDAFWSRSRDTVKGHLREARFMARYGKALGFTPMPALGPFRLGQHNGMLQAILLEMRLLEKGRKGSTVSYDTARSIRSTSTGLWDNSPMSGSDIVLASNSVRGRYVATMCPSESRWYSYFAVGCSVRKGDIVSQDRAYTIEVVLAVIAMFEKEFQELGYDIPLHSMESLMFFLGCCTGGFRGYETVWTDLGALAYDIEYCEEIGDESAVSWPVTGRFKNERGRWGHYMVPIAGVTASGICVFRWSQRAVKRMALAGRTDGWLFRKADGKTRAIAADYADNIYSKLEHLQETTSLIDDRCDVRNDYGMQRSGRRFFDTHCLNQKVSETDIAFQCRWRMDRAKGGRTVQRSMVHTYAEVRNMKPTLLRPSQAI